MPHMKIISSRNGHIHKYGDLKRKIYYCNVNIYFNLKCIRKKKPYILESNPHPFYSFRGLKNQMRIRILIIIGMTIAYDF